MAASDPRDEDLEFGYDPEREPWMRRTLLNIAYAIRRPDVVKPGENRGDGEYIWIDERMIIITTEGEPDWVHRPSWSRGAGPGPGEEPLFGD